jgi:hypothetical protein
MFRKFILISSFLLYYLSGPGQNWIRIFSDPTRGIWSEQLGEVYDGGYILGANLIWSGWARIGQLIKLDINGNIIWTKSFGNGGVKWGIHGFDQTPDRGVIIAGVCDTLDPAWQDGFVIKLDACMEPQWCKMFHLGDGADYTEKILALQDNTSIVLFRKISLSPFDITIWLIHLDETGEMVWMQEYLENDSLSYPEEEHALYLTPDNKYLITGTCYSTIYGQTDPKWPWPMLILADSSGEGVFEIPWGYKLPFPEMVFGEGFQSVQLNEEIYSAISDYHYPANTYAPCLIKTNLSGDPVSYQDLIQGTAYGSAGTITKFPDSIFFIGSWYAFNLDTSYLSVLKTDINGNIIKSKIISGTTYSPTDAIRTFDNKYLIQGINKIDDKFITYLWKLNYDLEYDTVYNQPRRYDSLCPDTITSSTIFPDCDVVVDVQGLTNEDHCNLHAYPNPAHNILHIDMPECIRKETTTAHFKVTTTFQQWHKDLWLQAYDPMGRMVYQQMVRPEEKKLELNVSSWQPGMYYFRLVYGDTMVASEKIIVQ